MNKSEFTGEFVKTLTSLYRMESITVFVEYIRGENMILDYLYTCDKDRFQPRELADALFVSSARITAALGALESKGLIIRERTTEDRRKILVSLTVEGRAYIEAKRQVIIDNLDEFLTELGEKDVSDLIRIISRAEKIMRKA